MYYPDVGQFGMIRHKELGIRLNTKPIVGLWPEEEGNGWVRKVQGTDVEGFVYTVTFPVSRARDARRSSVTRECYSVHKQTGELVLKRHAFFGARSIPGITDFRIYYCGVKYIYREAVFYRDVRWLALYKDEEVDIEPITDLLNLGWPWTWRWPTRKTQPVQTKQLMKMALDFQLKGGVIDPATLRSNHQLAKDHREWSAGDAILLRFALS